MAKLVLNDLTTTYGSQTLINNNNASIEDHLNNKVLYRNNPAGEPNQMENQLDMNSNKITNVADGTNNSDAVNYGQLRAASFGSIDPLDTVDINHNNGSSDVNLATFLNSDVALKTDVIPVFASFAAMLAADLADHQVVITKAYWSDWESNPTWPRGNGVYARTVQTGTAGTTDNGSYFIDTGGRRWELVYNTDVTISQFGAKPANDTFDNRARIQACIDFCTTSGANFVVDPLEQTWDASLNGGSGGYVDRYFGVSTFHPDYPEGCCLVFEEPRNMFIFGNTSRVSSIRYYGNVAGQCVVKFGSVNTTDWGYVVDGLGVSATASEPDQAGCLLDYAVYGRNTTGIARSSFRNCTFSGGLLRVMDFHGYMCDFQQVEVKYGQAGGIKFDGPSNLADGSDPVTTSITLQNLWARQCGGTGIHFRNQAWYVNLISCGVDGAGPSTATSINRPAIAYEFGNVRGMTMNSCGAEEVDRVFKAVSCDSINIVGIKGTGWGKTDGTVADYAMEITGNGTNVNISGWPKGTAVTTGVAPTKKYNYVLGVTKGDGAMGNLLVQIMDNGINYLETYYVANSGTYTIPIVWPNDTADGAHRAQRKTGNTTWPNKGPIIAPADGQYGTEGCLRKVVNIAGEATFTTHQILRHYGGNTATTYAVSVTLSSQSGSTAAKWDGVANVTASGKNVAYFTKTSGNSAAVPTLAWNGDFLEFSAGVNLFESIIDVTVYSASTIVSTAFLK